MRYHLSVQGDGVRAASQVTVTLKVTVTYLWQVHRAGRKDHYHLIILLFQIVQKLPYIIGQLAGS